MGYSISWMTPPLKKTDVSTDPPNILDVLVAYKLPYPPPLNFFLQLLYQTIPIPLPPG